MEAGRRSSRRRRRSGDWLREHAINIYAGLAIAYLLIPIAVIILFSFNDPTGKYNFTWVGFTLDHWATSSASRI